MREMYQLCPEAAVTRHIVAVALVTEAELEMLGQGFDRAFRVEETPCFGSLLQAIDEADRNLRLEVSVSKSAGL